MDRIGWDGMGLDGMGWDRMGWDKPRCDQIPISSAHPGGVKINKNPGEAGQVQKKSNKDITCVRGRWSVCYACRIRSNANI